jgi:hypothetical protein
MYYSKSTGCTYLAGVHDGRMPVDAVLISKDRYNAVIASPAPGMVRDHDAEGLPILIDPPAKTLDELSGEERSWRDAEIDRVKWLRERHRDQLEIGEQTTLAPEQFNELLIYVQSLRDWPAMPEFPAEESRPVVPDWVAAQIP